MGATAPYWAMVRFGRWSEILADKGPRLDSAFSRGAWRFARAMALTATGRLDQAEQELAALKKDVDDPSLAEATTSSLNTGVAILRIAPEVVAGEMAARRKEWDTAVLHLDRAIRYEDALIYQEPPDLARARPPESRRGAAERRSCQRGRGGLLGRSQEESAQRLVAVWSMAGAQGAEQDGRGSRGRSAIS
jgi:hypothetical protein